MANCEAGVGRFLPQIDLGRCLNSRHIIEWGMERQAPFLKSVLQEANQHKRQELLRMATEGQINAISELVMNTIRGTVPALDTPSPCSNTILSVYEPWPNPLIRSNDDALS